jgi:hypothetical protein
LKIARLLWKESNMQIGGTAGKKNRLIRSFHLNFTIKAIAGSLMVIQSKGHNQVGH